MSRSRLLACALISVSFSLTTQAEAFPVSGAAWSETQWEQHCKDVRTSYNPAAPLDVKALTLKQNNPRFLDFLYPGGLREKSHSGALDLFAN